MNALDSITFSVIWSGLVSAAAEMGETLTRTAYSVAVREGTDFSTGVFDSHANMVAQGDYSPGHLGSMAYAVGKMLEVHPLDTLSPGDAIICNDPGIGSGHLPDIYMMYPIFLNGECLGFAVNIAHQIDIGGSSSGSQNIAGVQDNFQEGLRFLPTKLYDRAEPIRDIFRIIEANVRVPDVIGDIQAQYNANVTGANRLLALAKTYGTATLSEAMAEIISRSEQQMRAAINRLKPGEYVFEDYMDDVGPNTEPVHAKVRVTIGDGKITLDWDGSGPQREAGMNAYLHYTTAYCIAAVKSVTLPMTPQNAGIIGLIEVKAPEGSFFNPKRPAACGGRAVCSHRIYEVAMGALSQATDEGVIAANSHFFNPNIGGIDSNTGKPFICWDAIIGGVGARTDKDGLEATSSPWNGTNVPIEIQEIRSPILIERLELIEDSAGAGEFRGGSGIRKDLRLLTDRATLTNLGDRSVFAPYGLRGGKPGNKGETILTGADSSEAVLNSKGTYTITRGEVISWRTSGAGGMGNPLERDPERVLNDVLDGFISVESAREDYRVVIDTEREAVNIEGTRAARSAKQGA